MFTRCNTTSRDGAGRISSCFLLFLRKPVLSRSPKKFHSRNTTPIYYIKNNMFINLCARCRLMLMGVVYIRHERRLVGGGGGSGGRPAVVCCTYFLLCIILLFIHCHHFFTYTIEVKMLIKLHIQT